MYSSLSLTSLLTSGARMSRDDVTSCTHTHAGGIMPTQQCGDEYQVCEVKTTITIEGDDFKDNSTIPFKVSVDVITRVCLSTFHYTQGHVLSYHRYKESR